MEIAEALDDPTARAYAFAAVHRANWAPGRLGERLSASTGMLTCARETGDLELELQAHGWLIVDLLEQGEIDAVDAQLEVFAAGAERLRQPLYLWNAAVWRAMRTMLAGRLEEAERLALDALMIGAGAEQFTAPHYYAIQVFLLRREQGRLEELLGPAREFAATLPAVPAWRAVFAWLQGELGQTEEALATFDGLAADGFGALPRDGNWIAALCVLAELCVQLGDARRAESLYGLLLPFGDLNVTVALAIGCLGSGHSPPRAGDRGQRRPAGPGDPGPYAARSGRIAARRLAPGGRADRGGVGYRAGAGPAHRAAASAGAAVTQR
jgi:hypothetical protein